METLQYNPATNTVELVYVLSEPEELDDRDSIGQIEMEE